MDSHRYRVDLLPEGTERVPCPDWRTIAEYLTMEGAEALAANYPAGEDVKQLRVVDMRTGGTSTTWYPPHRQAAVAAWLKRSGEAMERRRATQA